MVDQLAAYVDYLLIDYVKNLNVGLQPSEYYRLRRNIASQLELSAHNMVREAVADLSKGELESDRVVRPRGFF